jgi:adenine-specific DNA-methyltransferase
MGSKNKLIPWIYDMLSEIQFNTALDAFSGSGVVSYLFKSMGKRVYSNDFLHFSSLMAKGLVENSDDTLDQKEIEILFSVDFESDYFISKTFKDIFYNPEDLLFLDKISANIKKLKSQEKRALAYTALFRSCVKKQPRGVFTVSIKGNESSFLKEIPSVFTVRTSIPLKSGVEKVITCSKCFSQLEKLFAFCPYCGDKIMN